MVVDGQKIIIEALWFQKLMTEGTDTRCPTGEYYTRAGEYEVCDDCRLRYVDEEDTWCKYFRRLKSMKTKQNPFRTRISRFYECLESFSSVNASFVVKKGSEEKPSSTQIEEKEAST